MNIYIKVKVELSSEDIEPILDSVEENFIRLYEQNQIGKAGHSEEVASNLIKNFSQIFSEIEGLIEIDPDGWLLDVDIEGDNLEEAVNQEIDFRISESIMNILSDSEINDHPIHITYSEDWDAEYEECTYDEFVKSVENDDGYIILYKGEDVIIFIEVPSTKINLLKGVY